MFSAQSMGFPRPAYAGLRFPVAAGFANRGWGSSIGRQIFGLPAWEWSALCRSGRPDALRLGT